jgi:hypothetical protein
MNPDDIRAWAENHAAAAKRERVESRNQPLTPEMAFEYALDLLLFDESQNGSPFEREDPVSKREDQQMWEAWAKLRARWNDGPTASEAPSKRGDR